MPASPFDAPAQVVDAIDALAASARGAAGDPAATEGLWRAILGLERWIAIARGSDEHPAPLVAQLPAGPMLLVFTTAARATDAGMSLGLSQDEATRLVAVPLPTAVAWAASFRSSGVEGVLVDLGAVGAATPLANLVAMHEWFEGQGTTGEPV